MATNYDRASLEITGSTYTLPISYSTLSLFSDIAHKDQVEVFRTNIESIWQTENSVTTSLTRDDINEFGIIKPEWMTFNETTKTITAITIPANTYGYTSSIGKIYAPVMVAAEPLEIRRRVVNADGLISWVTGTKITADQLNLLSHQLLGVGQENRFDLEKNVLKFSDADIEYATPAYVDEAIADLADTIDLPAGVGTGNRDKSLVVLSYVGAENIPQAAASLKWDVTTSKLSLIGQVSQTQNRLEFLASDGTTLVNYFNSRGVLNNAGRIYYGILAPTPNASDTGLLWWDTNLGNQVLKVWDGLAWVSLTVGAGSYVTLTGIQTISGAKTFTGGLSVNTSPLTLASVNLQLNGAASIAGSGASKSIELKPTNASSIAATVLTASSTQVTVASSIPLDFDTLGSNALNLVTTLNTAQTITGTKTFDSHIILGPSVTFSSQSNITTSMGTTASDGSNLVFRINASASTRYIKLFNETDTVNGIELRSLNQAGNGRTKLIGPTTQTSGDLTLDTGYRIRNLKDTRIPGTCMTFHRPYNETTGTMAKGPGFGTDQIPECTITSSYSSTYPVITIENTGSLEQSYRIAWEQHPPPTSTSTTARFINLNPADAFTVAPGATVTWNVSTSHSATYNSAFASRFWITVLY